MNLFWGRFASKSWDLLIALGLALAYGFVLLRTSADIGYARDEGFYFQAARAYASWFRLFSEHRDQALERTAVDAAFATNHEHPGLIKSLFALSWLAQEKWRFFAWNGTSFRFPAIVLSSMLVGVVYQWVATSHGRIVAVVAALSLGFMPRVFFNAHLACFDVPIAALFAFTAFAYVKATDEGGIKWPIVTGICFGLALASKHNSWFLPIAVTAHVALLSAWALWVRAGVWTAVRRSVATLGVMAVLGPLLFVALWPWMWNDTFARIREYVRFHWQHEYYNMEFLGVNYFEPPMPRGYAWLMTLATVPAITLLLFALGFGRRLVEALGALRVRSEASVTTYRDDLFFALCLGACYGPWLSTNTPIFGGTKHWITAYPFVVLFAARGLAWAIDQAKLRADGRVPIWVRDHVVPLLLGVACVAGPVAITLHGTPWGLTAYTPIVGGPRGAASLGLNRGFWGYTTANVLSYLNETMPKNGKLYIHDTAGQAWDMLVEEKRVRPDIRVVWSAADADAVIYHHEMHMQQQEYQAWVAYAAASPSLVLGLDGVPVVMVYTKPRAAKAAPIDR